MTAPCAGRLALLAVWLGCAPAAMADPGEIERGREAFRQCYACHTAYRSERGEHGLSLWRVVGRRAAAVRGYDYSPALRAQGRAGLVWTEAELDRFLADPRAAVPGTAMPFPGIKDPRERADLISFLRRAEAAPPPRRR